MLHADDEGVLRGRVGVRDAARLRRRARSSSTRISTGSPPRPSGCALPAPPRDAFAAAAQRRRSPPAARPTRRCACSGRPAASGGGADRARARVDAAAGSRRAARARAPARRRPLGARRARRREVDELRREHGGAGRGGPRAAPTTRSSSRPTARCSRRRRRTSGSARATRLLTPSLDAAASSPASRARPCCELAPGLGYEVEEGAFPLERLLAADEVFLSLFGPRGDAGRRGRRRRESRAARPRQRSSALCGRAAGYPEGDERDEKIRLGGMALPNGVLVHGPTSWACAIRAPGRRASRSRPRCKRFRASQGQRARSCAARRGSLEAMALLPQVKRALPEAQLPMQSRRVVSRDARRGRRRARHSRVEPPAPGGAGAARPASSRSRRRRSRCAAASSPRITAPSTSRSARYEHGDGATEGARALRRPSRRPAPRDVGGRQRARRARAARACATRRARPRSSARVAASTEIFGWMTRNPDNLVAQALSKPGHELQHRLSTAEPTPEQLEVAEAALAACLELEHGADRPELGSRPRSSTCRSRRCAPAGTRTRTSTTRATRCSQDGRHPRVVMQVFQKNDAWLGGMDEAIAILKLCADDFDGARGPRALRRRPHRAVRAGHARSRATTPRSRTSRRRCSARSRGGR